MSDYYILNEDNVPIPCDTLTWANMLESDRQRRIVRQEAVGDYWISTIFLGLNYQFGDGPPLIFETMVFDSNESSERDRWIKRVPTYELALDAHREAIALAEKGDFSDTD